MSERSGAGRRIVERWSPPRVEGTYPAGTREPHGSATAARAAAAQQAEAAGYAAGLERAGVELQARLAQLDTRIRSADELLRQLANPLRILDAEVEQSLFRLSLAIGTQLARRALRADPAQIIAIIRECLKQLPLGARDVRITLHPEDAAVVRERLAAPSAESAWHLLEDPTLTRGGCLVHSEHSQLDARFESRVNALIVSALGDERAAERPGDAAESDAAEPGPAA